MVEIKVVDKAGRVMHRPWNDPHKGAIMNTPAGGLGRTLINTTVPGTKTGWWELPPKIAYALEEAQEATRAIFEKHGLPIRLAVSVEKKDDGAPAGYQILLNDFVTHGDWRASITVPD